MMTLFRKSVILTHRYLGIALSLLFVLWFVTGITMMYAGGMPRVTPDERLERLVPVDLRAVRLSPSEAAARANVDGNATALLTVMDRPAYRVNGTTVFADTGDLLDDVDPQAAVTIASRFMNVPAAQIHFVETLLDTDQWTIGQSRNLPLHRFAVDDAARTELYVSAWLGEVTMATTRKTRALAWLGTIPHWFYFSALRANQPLWYQVVVWTSGLGVLLALLGLILGVIQYRWSRPRPSTGIPYSGWMRWHYVTGIVFGFFTLTWVFSGLLSMEPFGWATQPGLRIPRDAFTGGDLDLAAFPIMDPVQWDRIMDGRAIKEVEFLRIQDEPYYAVRTTRVLTDTWRPERLHQPYNVSGRLAGNRFFVHASTLAVREQPFSLDSIVTRLKQAVPDVPIVDASVLPEYDSYYYSRGRQTPLPIVRVKFADEDKTWVYVDPSVSQVVARIHRLDRVERWLYNGLHSLDFSFWYNRRPLWDIGVLTLMLGGLASSSIGFYLGIRRLRRGVRTATALSPASSALDTRPA
jgi:PepSY-associated transmembrane protein